MGLPAGLWRAAGMRGLWGLLRGWRGLPSAVGWALREAGLQGALVDYSAGTFGGEAGARCWLLACAWARLCCGARGWGS